MDITKVFDYDGNDVRTVIDAVGVPWFAAKDVCEVLEITNHRTALNRLGESQKGVHSMDTLGGVQTLATVNEAGLYKLIFTSRKPEAERFSDWVASEVLPSIRKTGKFENTQKKPTSTELMLMYAQQLVEQEKRLLEVEQRVDKQGDKVDKFAAMLADTPDRAKVNRRIEELARKVYRGDKQEASNALYAVIKDKIGFDVHKRVKNKRNKLQEKRIGQDKEPYAVSTLKTKVTGISVLEEHNMLGDAMEFLAGMLMEDYN